MIQKKFLCKDYKSAEASIGQISKILTDTPHRSAVITFYEKGFSKQEVASLLACIKDCGHDELLVAGISVTLIAELMPEGTGIQLNLILAEEAEIEVVPMPCMLGEELSVAEKLKERLFAHEHVRVVELFGSNMALNTTKFMKAAMEGHEDAVLFGTSTIRGLPAKLSVEENENIVEIEQGITDLEMNEFVIAGDCILNDGFVAVIFAGEKLRAMSNYALGWNPIGRKMVPELGECAARGETVIKKINDSPAVDIYKEYLGVYPDSFLIGNVCEFPFIVERDGIDICMIPIDCGNDGELFFMMTVDPGERIRFTFASHDEVLAASRRSLEDMEDFRPEALFLTLCGNRINFLKEDAHIEWDSFSDVSSDYALMHGACELYYHGKKGGILNSAHLAIGMRENDTSAGVSAYYHPAIESLRKGRILSLSDRMSVFLSRITTELLDMAKEAKDANNAKSAFLSHISHEIRTPINAILGMNEMILQECEDESVLEYAEGIRSSGSNLLGIVNDILDFSRIEAGKLSIIPVEYDLPSVINDLRNTVRLRASDKGLVVKFDIDPLLPVKLYGDEMRIKQVVTNLLTNAVKYTEKGSVTLGISKKQRNKDKIVLRISVTDTGIGIRPEDMEKLFVEYERFDESRNRSIEGTGLGLSIVKELLELMGTRLYVNSTYGEGSEFYFEIEQGVCCDRPVGDIGKLFTGPVTVRHRNRFTAEDARILIVDDSAVNLTVITNLLKKTGIKIDTSLSGKEALDMVCKNHYDIIFLDHLMPGMDGNETFVRMKALEKNLSASSPVIALSADVLQDSVEEYKRLGYATFLAKPINPRELEDMLIKYIPREKMKIDEVI